MSLVGDTGRVKVPQELKTVVSVHVRASSEVKDHERREVRERAESGAELTSYELAVMFDELLYFGYHVTRAVWHLRSKGYVDSCVDLQQALEALDINTQLMHPSLALIEWVLFDDLLDLEPDPEMAHRIRSDHRAIEIWRQITDRIRVGGESSLNCSVEEGIAHRSAVSLVAHNSDLTLQSESSAASKICIWKIGEDIKVIEQLVGNAKQRPHASTVVIQVNVA